MWLCDKYSCIYKYVYYRYYEPVKPGSVVSIRLSPSSDAEA